jgi:hypothetical protein
MRRLALIVMLGLAIAVQAQNVTRPASAATWEAVSIKPCSAAGGVGRGSRGGGTGGVRVPSSSPGRLDLTCTTVARLIVQAYLSFQGLQAQSPNFNGGRSEIVIAF